MLFFFLLLITADCILAKTPPSLAFDAGSAPVNMSDPLDAIFASVDTNKRQWIDLLAQAVAVKSVSAWPDARQVSLRSEEPVFSRNKKLTCGFSLFSPFLLRK